MSIRLERTPALDYAIRMIERDHETVFNRKLHITEQQAGNAVIVVRYANTEDRCPEWAEAFGFRFLGGASGTELHIIGRDELGLIYGLLHYSRHVLGVDPFWYWADLPPIRQETITILAKEYNSVQPKARYRGWFVNDEVCLIGWKDEYPPTSEVWLPVFEALLRCGGNMVIPGTDLPKTGIHTKLAAEMGLWVSHHHAEPLGAEMFLRAYPGRQASYQDHPELFEALWREAIVKQKDDRVVWVLSFRGQGDKPFWENDPSFDTSEKRGGMISYVVRRQYEMIREVVTDPVCSMAMYGEIAELYKAGHIEVPDGIILIWADNGYGKMVSRRHGNLNLRVPALPAAGDGGRHGIYYHVTFHDLQASNHLAMFSASPELIVEELKVSFDRGASDYVLVNCGNIRPHLYTLDLVSQFWSEGEADYGLHLDQYSRRMYTTDHKRIASLYKRYFEATIAYGPNPDDRAGDEFYHHPARQIIGHWLQDKHDKTDARLIWATGDMPFEEQVRWFQQHVEAVIPVWTQLKSDCKSMIRLLPDADGRRLQDHLLLHIEIHLTGCRGFSALCSSYEQYRNGQHPLAFVQASQALWNYKQGIRALKQSEHGKWKSFYRADWLTNIKNTMDHTETLRRFIRMNGDSPDMFLWYKEFLMPETEKHIYLENTHRKPLSNDALSRRLKQYYIEKGLLRG